MTYECYLINQNIDIFIKITGETDMNITCRYYKIDRNSYFDFSLKKNLIN